MVGPRYQRARFGATSSDHLHDTVVREKRASRTHCRRPLGAHGPSRALFDVRCSGPPAKNCTPLAERHRCVDAVIGAQACITRAKATHSRPAKGCESAPL
ncbi:hypothetical protein CB0940_08973 [Cercospora beticola]|uniref:Uncharacterized protein n=1 Tax=Cercospora beticola TaxID=122368 RepID=A0A2G5HR90_CERBT|nr:hypothetical protein CB0940_08973 [Cercospora beticola]PIA95061.1 hypothetical protein CB0940_08973 [Cercospora beticola]